MPPRESAPAQAVVIAWDRASMGRVSDHNVLDRYSVQHVVRSLDGTGADHALCGCRVPWVHVTAGDSRRCPRCFAAAARAGMVDDYGVRIEG